MADEVEEFLIEARKRAGILDQAPPQTKQKEKRKHTRFRVNMPAFIRLSSGDVVKAQAVDLSMGGMYIEYGSPADAGKVFELLFDLPFDNDFKRVYVKAEVVRSIIIGDRDVFGIALVFREFARDTEQVLGKYLDLRALKRSL
ncbi:MAG: PilZ domain-containing protein [Gammaproteobacteria bacterium]|nr:PilZ domain-containing protein [Gammaproteobacteria bacterium]